MSDVIPGDPHEAGVPEESPDDATAVEAARVLANDAKPRLKDEGFDDDQIRRWAETYVTEHGSGDVDEFVDWIDRNQR